ncbi:Rieske 2Fe-2S domain-containing protein [Litoribacter ruber]|uniref:Rieske 2Fe-2S domain-containing protein n=1 Tax=Litoribacter ruber TaxID=702568 RepID=A0AAP2G0S5_9BACT|nr:MULTISPECIES: Rieske 2Fe-2S domain-containing protein [Litoribacter]MBS9523369.1 Rieske 2Fe-2S domain-containing protein [Litoribacter alkaliphilus]MBT0812505.1 Rieske 2Fe-2S domain-containing protein [Litoribacter ruber]
MSKKFTLGTDRASALSMLPERAIRKVQLGSDLVCLARVGEKVFAFQHLCPHQSASLADGKINGFEEVICPLHHYRFDLHTGDLRSGGNCPDLKVFSAELTDEGINILI